MCAMFNEWVCIFFKNTWKQGKACVVHSKWMANLWPPIGSWVYEIIPKEPAPKEARTIPEINLEKKPTPKEDTSKSSKHWFFLGEREVVHRCQSLIVLGLTLLLLSFLQKQQKQLRVDRRRGHMPETMVFTLLWKGSPKVRGGPLPAYKWRYDPYKWFRTLLYKGCNLIYNYTP